MGVSYIIYIDDDMLYKSTWVEQMYNMRKPTHFITWYVKLFTYNNDCIDYNNTNNDYILLNYSLSSLVRLLFGAQPWRALSVLYCVVLILQHDSWHGEKRIYREDRNVTAH